MVLLRTTGHTPRRWAPACTGDMPLVCWKEPNDDAGKLVAGCGPHLGASRRPMSRPSGGDHPDVQPTIALHRLNGEGIEIRYPVLASQRIGTKVSGDCDDAGAGGMARRQSGW